MQLEVTNALHRQKTVEEALNDAQAQIDQILGNYPQGSGASRRSRPSSSEIRDMTMASALDQRRRLTGYCFVTPTITRDRPHSGLPGDPVGGAVVRPVEHRRVGQPIRSSVSTTMRDLLDNDRFWNALAVTFVFTALSHTAGAVLGIGLALMLNESFHGKGLARLAVLFPWALPTALNALMWRWMYNADYGLFNDVALQSGIVDQPINWLGDATLAMGAMVVVSVWKTSSFMALIILAGLQSIPRELYEAGRMDGMNRWREFSEITLPLLKGPILVALDHPLDGCAAHLRTALQSDRWRAGDSNRKPIALRL